VAELSVNVDHVATIRQARLIDIPDPAQAAILAELAGARGIICHLREDRRHVNDRDLRVLKEVVKTRLNLEMAATEEIKQIALEVKPDMITLVPEKRQELTTEGGLEVAKARKKLGPFIKEVQAGGILVSLFIDPDEKQVKAAAELGADYIELHTGHYAEAKSEAEALDRLAAIAEMSELGQELDLRVHAGHGLDYRNIHRFADCPAIEEYSIGHAIIARAVLVGLERAVMEMIDLVRDF